VLVLVTLAATCMACTVCKPQCDDWLDIIPANTLDAGAWPPTSTYAIEIEVADSRYECSGYFKAENDDEWTCSEGIEAHSRTRWETPTFVIYRSRDELGDLETVHVKIWREDVVIFDDHVDIWWQRANDASTDTQPCDNLGCWLGVVRANIQSFEGLEEAP
jgi:hypothetical protein